jgi:ABC-type nitrate/sulfonate/bicarbonate transport system permease component
MKIKLSYIFLLIVLLVTWHYSAENNNSIRLLISSPVKIFEFFKDNKNDLLMATGVTLYESVMGLLISTILSFTLMIISFYIPKFLNFIMPLMVTSQIIPLIVLAPFFILFFGVGYTSKIAMATVISFFPIFVNFAMGYKAIPKEIEEYAYINNTSTWVKIQRIYFPLSTPSIIAGLKISSTLSVIGAIVAEFTGSKIGLGKNLFLSAKRLEPELMMSSLFLSILIGGILFVTIIGIGKLTHND